jgi:hypothetical protein
MKKILIVIFCLVVILTLWGCATIFKGGSQVISVNTSPDTAKIYMNGVYMGVTPLQLLLKSNQTYIFEFRKDGYESKTVILNNQVGAGWVILDILVSFWPLLIDAITGDWYYLQWDNVNAALVATK